MNNVFYETENAKSTPSQQVEKNETIALTKLYVRVVQMYILKKDTGGLPTILLTSIHDR